jgi:hypothetical protein
VVVTERATKSSLRNSLFSSRPFSKVCYVSIISQPRLDCNEKIATNGLDYSVGQSISQSIALTAGELLELRLLLILSIPLLSYSVQGG